MRTATILTAAAVFLVAGCGGLATADDPLDIPEPGGTAGPAAPAPGSPSTPGSAPGDSPLPDEAPPGDSPLPDDYPWEPRQSPPPHVDGDDGGEPWVGGFDTVVLPERLEVVHDGAATYSVTGIEIYEQGPDQSRVVVSYTGGEGLAGLDLSVAGATDLPPEVALPGGVDTGLAFLTGAQAPLGGALEPGQLIRPEAASRVHGVSVGPPDTTMGTGVYVGMDAGAVLWAVPDHAGTLVLIVTDPGTGPTS
ncbi:hypothetical protein KZX45_15710 [Georgenia sp. EYE_87]|uniref:hypothetical protein n=1 Tax=Georgenia sp. EYE_87 TaxID=2853448 RepID=UPI002003521A|nr:hypothetical protein [Georgenia sp. EYE_87]MCK6211992.1 hypothetical protein [Georgenia sp. EYE_87]